MGQTNSNRVSHRLETNPVIFRDDHLEQILNDLGEEDTGQGFSEVMYLGATPFTDKIITWDSSAKIKKRAEIQFTYSPFPFISTIIKKIMDQETGLTEISRITASITYNTNKTIKEVDVVTSRT